MKCNIPKPKRLTFGDFMLLVNELNKRQLNKEPSDFSNMTPEKRAKAVDNAVRNAHKMDGERKEDNGKTN